MKTLNKKADSDRIKMHLQQRHKRNITQWS